MYKIVEYVTDGKLEQVQRGMSRWIDTCPRVLSFLETNSDKVRKKIKTTTPDGTVTEDLKDVCFELEIAYLLVCDKRFEVEYEKFGKGPDYTVTFAGNFTFNVEVKRIREAALNKRLAEWRDTLQDKVKQRPSPFGFSLDHRTLHIEEPLAKRLEAATEDILQFISASMTDQAKKLPVDSLVTLKVPGFEHDLEITLSRPKGKTDHSYTSITGGSSALFYKNEAKRFLDTICEKLDQLIPDMPNVLVFNSGSSTHDIHHLQIALERLQRRIDQNDDEFFREYKHEDVQDFVRKASRLTAVVFRSMWIGESADRNFLWANATAAQHLPDAIHDYLRKTN